MFISKVEFKKASNGNTYKQVTFDRKLFGDKDRTNVFNDHAMYEDITEGKEIADNLLFVNQRGYLELTNPDKGIKKGLGRSNLNIAVAQENKAQHIKEAQENKNEAIKVSSTARDATLILTSLMVNPDYQEDWKTAWKEIRNWLWNEFDDVDHYSQPPL